MYYFEEPEKVKNCGFQFFLSDSILQTNAHLHYFC